MKIKRFGHRSFRIYTITVFLILAAVVSFLILSMIEKKEKPSVLFLVIDTLRSDHLGCFGYPRNTSPNIDRLTSEGVMFENAFSQSSWTLPSMMSMMIGRHIFCHVDPLPDHTKSLAELMKQQGYQTAGFVSNPLVGVEQGFSKGFDEYFVSGKKRGPNRAIRKKDKDNQLPGDRAVSRPANSRPVNNPYLPPPEDKKGDLLTKTVMNWLGGDIKPPFFLYVHYIHPHKPYTPPKGYTDFDDAYDPITPEMKKRFSEFADENPDLKIRMQQDFKKMRRNITLYDGEIKFVDKCVGDLLDELDRLDLTKNTVVVITSDHGEGLWNHLDYRKYVEEKFSPKDRNLTNYFFETHGMHLFDELIRIPLIFRGPGILKNKVVNNVVENIDIMPTLLALAGKPPPYPGDGQSLYSSLVDPVPDLPDKDLIFSYCSSATCAILPSEGLKLLTPNPKGHSYGLESTLFDLSRDPGETEDFSKDENLKYRKAFSMLEESIKKRKEKDPLKKGAQEFSQATKEAMRELGYIE